MTNQEVAKILYEIASFLEMDEVQFKPQAYRKAAVALESLSKDVKEVYEEQGEEGIKEIPGVGESIASKIIEYIKTGEIEYYQELKEEMPIEIDEITDVEGIGPKVAQDLYEHLEITNLEELEEAAKKEKIRDLSGFGKKTEQNILEGIEFLKKSKGRFVLADIMPAVEKMKSELASLAQVDKIKVAGSVRRKKETIGDADFLVVSDQPEKVMEFFINRPQVVKVWSKGETKSSVRLKQDFDVDLRVVPEESFGAALQYFTGSKDHNIQTRRIAIDKGFKLNEYGLFEDEERIAGKTEEEIYNALDLEVIPPELREDRGEIEASQEGQLPDLVELSDIKGDLHCHTDWNGGSHSIMEMAEAAVEKGYDYLGIADHTRFLKIENGLDEKQLNKQRKEIKEVNKKLDAQGLDFKVLQGAETNILKDGSIDIDDEVMKKLDYVIAGVHSHFTVNEDQMTKRIVKAVNHPQVDIISHPTGRILKQRDEYDINFDKILKEAKRSNTVLEINSSPQRLDLNDVNIKKAIESGVELIINTDAHQKEQLRYMKYGIYQARRGWAEARDIINAQSLDRLLRIIK
ncbi:MAG: DNA polymerase/3'-5' exonuclease PolX [Candidatus Paceibacterota bacterium]